MNYTFDYSDIGHLCELEKNLKKTLGPVGLMSLQFILFFLNSNNSSDKTSSSIFADYLVDDILVLQWNP